MLSHLGAVALGGGLERVTAKRLGAIQGVFLTIVLATQRTNRTANRLLAVAMLAFSIHLVTVVYYGVGLEAAFPHFIGVGYPMPLLYGPLTYLYAVCASDRARGMRRADALHFAPSPVPGSCARRSGTRWCPRCTRAWGWATASRLSI